MAKKKKIRADFRKNRGARTRQSDWTSQYEKHQFEDDESDRSERISGKGELSRRRTIVGTEIEEDDSGQSILLEIDLQKCQLGRVLSVHGLHSFVEAEDKSVFRCTTRRILKTLSTDQRHVVIAGDMVYFQPADNQQGMIQRVEPRHGVISRTSRGRQHIIVSNVDQFMIITSLAEPNLKPNLIDRMLVTAERSRIEPIICFNKVDLINPADIQPLVGLYSQMGYQCLLLSAETGVGMERFRQMLIGKSSVVAGQSGVGKSSLLNAAEKDLSLKVSHVSTENQKGRHTTTAAKIIPLTKGGYVVDTPGIRQFQLWDIIEKEVAGYLRDLRSFESLCKFPNCTHTHEDDCAVKNGVADGLLDLRRYESYCQMIADD